MGFQNLFSESIAYEIKFCQKDSFLDQIHNLSYVNTYAKCAP